MNEAGIERAMAATPAFEGVPRKAIRDLVELGSVKRFRRGTYLYHQEDDARDVFFLYEGRVELSSISVTGDRGLHTALEPPQFFGELGVLAGTEHSSSALALEDCTAWVVRGAAFLDFLAEQPPASMGLLRALARQVLAHESLVDDLLFLDLKGRVAKRLIGLVAPRFDELPRDGAVIPSIVTHADLASLAGGSRENVTRILSEFQRRGIVARDGRRYVLKDIRALRRLARLEDATRTRTPGSASRRTRGSS